jgi:hypothetical protein
LKKKSKGWKIRSSIKLLRPISRQKNIRKRRLLLTILLILKSKLRTKVMLMAKSSISCLNKMIREKFLRKTRREILLLWSRNVRHCSTKAKRAKMVSKRVKVEALEVLPREPARTRDRKAEIREARSEAN